MFKRRSASSEAVSLAATTALPQRPSATTIAAPPQGPATMAAPPEGPATMPAALGRYLVIDEIGRGGMGVVLRAYDPRLQREVALKCVRTDELSGDAHARMLREAQAMAMLSHPNVVGVYDVDSPRGEVVIAMEYVRGATLKKWLVARPPPSDIMAMFVAAGRGLAAAHAVGLLHRDFKPANVLVGHDSRPRVTDFGLARATVSGSGNRVLLAGTAGEEPSRGELTEAGLVLGTPRYMAPEQHAGGELLPATDQYAFCVALWEALTGEPPFVLTTLAELAERKRGGPPPWPADVPVHRRIRECLQRGLAPSASDRWPSMEALLQALVVQARPRGRVVLLTTSVGGVVAMGTVAWAAHAQRIAERCTGAGEQIATVWDEERRDLVQQAISQTGVSYAGEVWERIAPQLDDYAARWAAIHTDACAATTVRGEQTALVMDLRMACLHRAKVNLQAVTLVLSHADAGVVEKAHQVVDRLPDLEGCSDVEALRAEVAPPAASHKEAVEAIRVQLAEIGALREAGKFPDALAKVQPLAREVETVPYRPVVAETLLELALALEYAGDFPEAERAFRQTLQAALSSNKWEEAALAASQLVHLVGWSRARPQEGLAYAQTAAGLAALTREPDAVRSVLHSHVGTSLQTLGQLTEAETEHRAAVALAERAHGPSAVASTEARADLAYLLMQQGRLREAEQERRLSLQLRQATLGAEHPHVTQAHYELANTIIEQGRFAEAEAEQRQVLAAWSKSLGPEHLNTARARACIGNALFYQGRSAEAVTEYRHALRSLRKTLGDNHHDVGLLRGSLVGALSAQGLHAEAVSEGRAGLAAFKGGDHPALPLVHNGLGVALGALGRHEEAEVEHRAAYEVALRVLGREHPHVGMFLGNWANSQNARGNHKAAEDTYRAVLERQISSVGPAHPSTLLIRARLGSTLRKQRRYREAELVYREALALHDPATPPQVVAELAGGLGWTQLERGENSEAARTLAASWQTWKNDDRVAAVSRARLGHGLAMALGKRDRTLALATARESLDLFDLAATAAPSRERAELEVWVRRHD